MMIKKRVRKVQRLEVMMGVRSWLVEGEEAYETINRQQIRLRGLTREEVLQAGAVAWGSSAGPGWALGLKSIWPQATHSVLPAAH